MIEEMLLRRSIGLLAGVGLFLAPIGVPSAPAPPESPGHPFLEARIATVVPASSEDLPPRRPGTRAVIAEGPSIEVRTTPMRRGAIQLVAATNPWNQPLAFPVVGRRDGADGRTWLRILLGNRPNSARGWVLADQVISETTHDRIVVDLSDRLLRDWHDGHLEQRFRVGIGSPNTQTPVGRFFVWASLRSDPGGRYGAYVLGLSGFPADRSAAPAGARIAIHGTNDPSDLGSAVSMGCVRVLNAQMLLLRDVPMGTPVIIRP